MLLSQAGVEFGKLGRFRNQTVGQFSLKGLRKAERDSLFVSPNRKHIYSSLDLYHNEGFIQFFLLALLAPLKTLPTRFKTFELSLEQKARRSTKHE